MKREFALIMAIAGLTIAALTIGACNNRLISSKENSSSILGIWQAVSYKYGSQSSFVDFPKNQRNIKFITENHFIGVRIDTTTKRVNRMAGGTYTLSGNTYTESIDFGLGMDPYLGQKHTFTIKVEGNMFFLSGSLSDGLKIEEIWDRVK